MPTLCLVGVSAQAMPAVAVPRPFSLRESGRPSDAMVRFMDPAWMPLNARGFVMPTKVGTHEFSVCDEKSRGWRAPRHSPRASSACARVGLRPDPWARHDVGATRLQQHASRLYSATRPHDSARRRRHSSVVPAGMPTGIDPSRSAQIHPSTQDSSVSLCLCGESCIRCRVPGPGPASGMRHRKIHHKDAETRRRHLYRRRAIRFGLLRQPAQACGNADASRSPAQRLPIHARAG
jgi:hypothetical protein